MSAEGLIYNISSEGLFQHVSFYKINMLRPVEGYAVAFESMPERHIFVLRTLEMFGLAAMSNPLQTCDGQVTTAISHRI